jgi:hypothetical protein
MLRRVAGGLVATLALGNGAAVAQDAPRDAAVLMLGATPMAATCVEHVGGQPGPAFPPTASRTNVFGNVVAALHFDAPDRPPEVALWHRPRASALAAAVHQWATGLRMPCHGGARHTVERTFAFRYRGEQPGFRDLQLPHLLALARGAEHRQPFDTTGMRCPLQVAWTYRQPQLPNAVRIEGEPDPAHAGIIDRLARMDLSLSSTAADIAWGSTARFEIPCHPQELPAPQPKE